MKRWGWIALAILSVGCNGSSAPARSPATTTSSSASGSSSSGSSSQPSSSRQPIVAVVRPLVNGALALSGLPPSPPRSSTPVGSLAMTIGASNPGARMVGAGSIGDAALELTVSANAGDVQIDQLQLLASSTGTAWQDVTRVTLVFEGWNGQHVPFDPTNLDPSKDLFWSFVPPTGPARTGSWGAIELRDTPSYPGCQVSLQIPAGQSADFLVLFDVAPSAARGTQLSTAAGTASGTDLATGAAIVLQPGPALLSGATMTVGP